MGLDLIVILGHEDECRRVWETQVLLLAYLENKIICFAGPYWSHLNFVDLKKWFPTCDDEYPIIHKENIRNSFLKDKGGIFRASPLKDRTTYMV